MTVRIKENRSSNPKDNFVDLALICAYNGLPLSAAALITIDSMPKKSFNFYMKKESTWAADQSVTMKVSTVIEGESDAYNFNEQIFTIDVNNETQMGTIDLKYSHKIKVEIYRADIAGDDTSVVRIMLSQED